MSESAVEAISEFKIEQIARVAHETIAACCLSMGDRSVPHWDEAPEWQRQSTISGVEYTLLHPDVTPSAQHEEWMRHKKADGWKYGSVKDPAKKEHPCMVGYQKLPVEHRIKDVLFMAVVNAFRAANRSEPKVSEEAGS